jgi:glycosyltransferase involved in cell wall biosynthesis
MEAGVALTVIGDGPARAGLEGLASEVFPATRFVGEVHGEGLEPYYQRADLFVLPGTGGLAVQEAMAHGLPVIVSEGDGTQEDLVSNENGWLIPPGDGNALLKALDLALQDPARLLEMGQRSFELVRERINIDVMADAFVTALNVVSGREK